MITRTLFASMGAVALLAGPMVASAATSTPKSTATSTMAPAKMMTPSACKDLKGKKLSDCKAKYEVQKKTTTSTTTHN